MPSRALLAAIERQRRRVWGLCYRMTGLRSEADDLSQEAIARAIEREPALAHRGGLEGWLFRITTTVCLDHLRRRKIERRATELADPLPTPELSAADADPEAAVILRDDVRFAVVVALQHLPPRQRAALILHEVLDRPLAGVARALGTSPSAAKQLVVRARRALAAARVHTNVDVPVDRAVVDRLVHAIETRSVEAFTALLADDVWGVTDGGGRVRVSTKPVFGARAVGRLWAAANGRQVLPVAARARVLNGEPAVVVTLPTAGDAAMASIHLETRRGRIVALRVVRDPEKLANLDKLGLIAAEAG